MLQTGPAGLDPQSAMQAMQGGTSQRIQAAGVVGNNAQGMVAAGNASLEAGTQLKAARIQAEAQKKAAMIGLAGSALNTVADATLGGINAATYARSVTQQGDQLALQTMREMQEIGSSGVVADIDAAVSSERNMSAMLDESGRLSGSSIDRAKTWQSMQNDLFKQILSRYGSGK